MSGKETAETLALIRLRLRYDPDTGKVYWRDGPCAGLEAGTPRSAYLSIRLGGVNYRLHRVAWALHHGTWPLQVIDHINCIGTDNRIANLRDVSPLENARNKRPRGRL